MNRPSDAIINELIDKVAKWGGCSRQQLIGSSRRAPDVRLRHLTMHALFRAGFTQADIAAAFQKDHVTVSHAVRAIEHHMVRRAVVRRQAKMVASFLEQICEKKFENRGTRYQLGWELGEIDARIKRLENRVAELENDG